MYVKQMPPSKLVGNLSKAALVGASGAVLSVLVLGGLDSVQVTGGMWVPKFAIQGVVLGASSVAASYVVPKLTPYVAMGSPQLVRFNSLILEPATLGIISLAVESIIAPDAAQGGTGGVLKTIMVGGAASVGAAYVSEGMGWSESVI